MIPCSVCGYYHDSTTYCPGSFPKYVNQNFDKIHVLYLITELRANFDQMSAQERLDVIDKLFEGYCQYCGYKIEKIRCYCRYDD